MLRQRKENETGKLYGVNLASADFKLQPGWFRSLQNWVPGKRFNLKKKRGVASVPSALTEFELSNPCSCPDTTVPLPQTLEQSDHYAIDVGNDRTSWAYVGAGREIYVLRIVATCGGGNAHYDTCADLIHILDGVQTIRNDLKPSNDHTAAANVVAGHSDEASFAFQNASSLYYHSVPNQLRTICSSQSGDGGFQVKAWCKHDTFIYCCINQTAFSNNKRVRKYNMSGTHIEFTDSLVGYSFINSMQANNDYLYALVDTGANDLIVRMPTGSLSDPADEIIDTGLTDVSAFYVVSNSLIYFVNHPAASTVIGIYAWDGSSIITVDSSVTLQTGYGSTGQQNVLHLIENSLYYGGDADDGTGQINIARIDLVLCP